jgi:hypothetical protein
VSAIHRIHIKCAHPAEVAQDMLYSNCPEKDSNGDSYDIEDAPDQGKHYERERAPIFENGTDVSGLARRPALVFSVPSMIESLEV